MRSHTPLQLSLSRRRLLLALGGACAGGLTGCASFPPVPRPEGYWLVNRLTWGATEAELDHLVKLGREEWTAAQLRATPADVRLPRPVRNLIDGMEIQRKPMLDLIREADALRRAADQAGGDGDAAKSVRKTYQDYQNQRLQEATQRHLLRAVHSDQQLLEHMTWFWMNHFCVFQAKGFIRVMVGDYEERAIRPHALGSFRAMLGASAHHPAMLAYLDNNQNAVNRLNENYARELLELHTLGVEGGYSQQDVQELARVLTGHGIRIEPEAPKVNPQREALYRRDGLYEFHPNRHDFGDKTVLGRRIKGRGAEELDEVLDLIAVHPATARFVSGRMARYLLADEPPAALVEAMAQAFLQSQGRIDATLGVLLRSPEFGAAQPRKFKDPMHYVVSAVRAAYAHASPPVTRMAPLQSWLNQLGQPLYGRQTPDGYPLASDAWNSSGQMNARFDVARNLASGRAALFGDKPAPEDPKPHLQDDHFKEVIRPQLSTETARALDRTHVLQDWNTLWLCSPEFMYR